MSIYDQLGQGPAPMNPMQMLFQIKQNPAAILKQAGLNIPSGMNNPQQIIQHLLQTGQVPQNRYQQVMQMAQRFKR